MTGSAPDRVAGNPNHPTINVFWEGSQFVNHSLALANREYCSQLLNFPHINLTIVPFEPDQYAAGDDSRLQRLSTHDLRNKKYAVLDIKKRPTVWVRHQWPLRNQKPPRGAKWVIMYPWEYSTLPRAYADVVQQADEIWTASTYSRRAMLESGINADKVIVIPNGVDTDRFTPSGQRFPLRSTKTFKLLFVGAAIYRKGVDILLEAYHQAFTAQDDVCLIIKEFASQTYKDQTAASLIAQYAAQPNVPEVAYLTDFLDEQHLAALYRSADVLVMPYRGEGFSLPTLEAMACGVPVIVTAGGATDDFVDDTVGWRINAGHESVGYTIYGLPLDKEGFLLRPDLDHLIELMRDVYAHRDEVSVKGQQARQASERWTWQAAAHKILDQIQVLTGVP
jgi:glycosyltransferase involved in cell wall biosynthesis